LSIGSYLSANSRISAGAEIFAIFARSFSQTRETCGGWDAISRVADNRSFQSFSAAVCSSAFNGLPLK
jgi:hypothetical protein